MDLIKVTNLCKNYGNAEILKNVNLTIREGEIYGFLGPNGAGKTTIMKILVQLTKAIRDDRILGKEYGKGLC